MPNLRRLERPVDKDVVTYLEEVLTKAKAGEIHGVLIVAQDPSGVSYSCAGLKDRFLISGWLFHAIHKLQSDPT